MDIPNVVMVGRPTVANLARPPQVVPEQPYPNATVIGSSAADIPILKEGQADPVGSIGLGGQVRSAGEQPVAPVRGSVEPYTVPGTEAKPDGPGFDPGIDLRAPAQREQEVAPVAAPAPAPVQPEQSPPQPVAQPTQPPYPTEPRKRAKPAEASKRQRVVVRSPGMGKHTVVVGDVVVSGSLVCLFYPLDDTTTIIEPPPTADDGGLVIVTNPGTKDEQAYPVIYDDWTAQVGESLMVVFLRLNK